MNILVLNAGSSSIKYKFFKDNKLSIDGMVDAIGLKNCKQIIKLNKVRIEKLIKAKNHKEALNLTLSSLIEYKIINNLNEINAIGHRVVHGGEKFKKATIINNNVIKEIKKLCSIAPLHNPHNLSGILECKKILPKVKQIAVFDTSFYNELSSKVYLYPIPYKFYTKYKIRKYGFHGISHKYVSEIAYKLLKSKNKKIITCHIGNGISITAINKNKAVDTSLGFTPLDGILMGTRSGSIDPSIPLFIQKKLNLNVDEVSEILNKKSGLKAISGYSDMRKIYELYNKKNKKAILAIDILCYKIASYIGSYTTIMKGLDALVFTGGIGENAFYIRKKVCDYLKWMGLIIDNNNNNQNKLNISSNNSKIFVFVIPTNEELEISKETIKLLNQK
jgi:acetate kinase